MGKIIAAHGHLITVVSSHTVDIIQSSHSGPPHEVPGGPALYIAEALDGLGCRYEIITGEVVRVEVVPTDGGEEYVIPPVPPIELPSSFAGDVVILSPVMREIDPSAVPSVDRFLAVDLQGFVRTPYRQSGSVSESFDLSELLGRASVVKASAGEIERLSKASRASVRASILVVTQGRQGARVESPDGCWEIGARPVAVSNTIGAGDTFLAGFVCALLDGASPPEAGDAAARLTESILQRRIPAG